MGAGKSAVGRRLAERLQRPFEDTDERIAAAAGASVAEIFAREGEEHFRRMERDAIESLAGRECVVALGGGAVAQPGAAERLGATGTVVYLRARPETLLQRVGEAGSRPLLRGLDAEERLARLRGLLDERREAYASAKLVVDTDTLSVGAVADRIASRL